MCVIKKDLDGMGVGCSGIEGDKECEDCEYYMPERKRGRRMIDRYLCKAKRKDNGEWVEGYLVELGKESFSDEIRFGITEKAIPILGKTVFNLRIDEVDSSTVCQCTDLKDRNGKLIWENDIARYADMITRVEKTDLIEWNETHASFVRLHRSQMGLQHLNIDEFIANGCEIIGNIFDNQELLEVE